MIHYFKILFFFFRASKIIVNSNNRAINILKRFGTCLRYSIIEYYSSSSFFPALEYDCMCI